MQGTTADGGHLQFPMPCNNSSLLRISKGKFMLEWICYVLFHQVVEMLMFDVVKEVH
jgi:hypothetical protein